MRPRLPSVLHCSICTRAGETSSFSSPVMLDRHVRFCPNRDRLSVAGGPAGLESKRRGTSAEDNVASAHGGLAPVERLRPGPLSPGDDAA